MSRRNPSAMNRRRFLSLAAGPLALSALPLAGCSSPKPAPPQLIGRVVVVGGGFAGATAARYIRKLDPRIEVTLVEPNEAHYTCPFSNAVIGGLETMASISHDYRQLQGHWGVRHIRAEATVLNAEAKQLMTSLGETIDYDKLVVAPGIGFDYGALEGYSEEASAVMPHAWTAGTQTTELKRRLEAMDDGGVAAIVVPRAPFRCPPGPYERASLFAHYLKQHKPRSKVLILDANEKFSKQGLFQAAWAELYGDMIEWVPISQDGAVTRVDASTGELFTEFETIRPAVANVIPPQRAAAFASKWDLADESGWCPVRGDDFASTLIPDVHVLGDASQATPMPKSASAANSQAKQCAVAVVAALRGEDSVAPLYHNTCYSLVAPDYGISVNAMYDAQDGAVHKIDGAGGLSAVDASAAVRKKEADYARGWYASITEDSFG